MVHYAVDWWLSEVAKLVIVILILWLLLSAHHCRTKKGLTSLTAFQEYLRLLLLGSGQSISHFFFGGGVVGWGGGGGAAELLLSVCYCFCQPTDDTTISEEMEMTYTKSSPGSFNNSWGFCRHLISYDFRTTCTHRHTSTQEQYPVS